MPIVMVVSLLLLRTKWIARITVVVIAVVLSIVSIVSIVSMVVRSFLEQLTKNEVTFRFKYVMHR